MAAFDMDDPQAVVSPGGVGFDINCGVRRNLFLHILLFAGATIENQLEGERRAACERAAGSVSL